MKLFFVFLIGVLACSTAFAVTTIASKNGVAGNNLCTGDCTYTDKVLVVGDSNVFKDINSSTWNAWGQIIGSENNISVSTHINVVGDNNLLSNTTSVDVLGTHNNVQKSSNALVSGSYNTVTAQDAVVLGNHSTVAAKNSVTLGDKSENDRDNTVSIGAAGAERQIINVAKATLATDAVNLGQMTSDINDAKNDAVTQSSVNTKTQIDQNNVKINQDIIVAKSDAVTQSSVNTKAQIDQNNVKINQDIIVAKSDAVAQSSVNTKTQIDQNNVKINQDIIVAKSEAVTQSSVNTKAQIDQNNVKIDQDIVAAKVNAVNTANKYSDVKYQMGVNYTDIKHAENITYATSVAQKAEENANLYTDYMLSQFKQQSNERFEQLSNKIDKAEKRLNAGIAGVTAISSIPYMAGNIFSYGIGLGNYQNGNAIALGGQYKVSSNGNARLNISWDSSQNVTLGLGLAGGW